jgi:glycosyltransferase involved in cell wall biosynthesis
MIVVPAGPIGRRALDRGLLPTSCYVLPSPTRASPESTGGAELRILSIGELTWRQGYEHGIHAVRLLLDRGVACRYRLIGTGNHEGALRFARSQLGVEREVELVGSIETAPLGQELASADVFLDPAVAKSPTTFASLAVELGAPVVTTRDLLRDDAAEVIRARRRDPGALAEGLIGLAAASDVVARRAARASSIEESPSLAAVTDRLAELYLQLLNESASVRG